MTNIKLEAMKEKIKDISEKYYFGRNRIEEDCANELLDLYNVRNCVKCGEREGKGKTKQCDTCLMDGII